MIHLAYGRARLRHTSPRTSYRRLAPIYDHAVDAPLRRARLESLGSLPADRPRLVLLDGIGTGLDLPHLPAVHRYVGLDLTRAMLDRARVRKGDLSVQFVRETASSCPSHMPASVTRSCI
jgi:hypothetical protein